MKLAGSVDQFALGHRNSDGHVHRRSLLLNDLIGPFKASANSFSIACYSWTAGDHAFFAGEEISIADFAIVGWVWRHERHKIDLAGFPNVERWYRAMMARPRVARGFDRVLKRPKQASGKPETDAGSDLRIEADYFLR